MPLLCWSTTAAISVIALIYAVTRAFVWDEGYHLLAAQQISQGRLPYIDFCFPQTPLNAYLNGAIIKLFGQHWQPVHVMATLFSLGAAFLTGQTLWSRFPAVRWRLACAVTALVFVGMNAMVIQFGTIGQAYGICLFFTVAAYRVALITPARVSVGLPLLSGALAGIAAGSSLLTAPTLAVLLIWIWRYDRVGLRWRKAFAYLAGAVIPFLPVLWLFSKGPEQTFFNVVKYHALYRRVEWPGAGFHDLRVFTSWLDSTQALMLVLLAVAGMLFLLKGCDWPRWQRAEFYLAAWIVIAEGAYLCTPHPTFGRYFVFLTPFITIVAMAGLYWFGCRLGYAEQPRWPAATAACLMALTLINFGVESFTESTWPEYEKIARKVADVTPPGAPFFADEVVYFALRRNPPSGMEVSYTHVLSLPPAEKKLLHIVSEAELKAKMARHEFVSVQSCSDPEMDRLGLPGAYRYKVDIDECTVFWGERPN